MFSFSSLQFPTVDCFLGICENWKMLKENIPIISIITTDVFF